MSTPAYFTQSITIQVALSDFESQKYHLLVIYKYGISDILISKINVTFPQQRNILAVTESLVLFFCPTLKQSVGRRSLVRLAEEVIVVC